MSPWRWWWGLLLLQGWLQETVWVMLVYLDDVFHRQKTAGKMSSASDLRAAIIEGGGGAGPTQDHDRGHHPHRPVAGDVGQCHRFPVMKRIAAPMVGGLISSTILTLVIIPAVYFIWKQWELKYQKVSTIS